MLTRRTLIASSLALAGTAAAQAPSPLLRMSLARAAFSATGLPDGSVLLIGGCAGNGCDTGPDSAMVDRFDPKTGAISRIGHLLAPRTDGAIALLPDGAVLLAGGWAPQLTGAVERFDPGTGKSTSIGAMSAPQVCKAVVLADGRVLLMGEKTVDVFDPASGRISQLSAASPFLDSSTVTLLKNGQVLVAGGGIHGPPRADAFLFDPTTGRSRATGSLAAIRRKHAAVRLDDGKVLIVGGADQRDRNGGKTKTLELYDPAAGRFSRVGEALDARYKIEHAAVKLADGRVLVAGGAPQPELIDPKTWTSRPVDIDIGDTLNFTSAVALPGGDVLVAGGYGERTINPTDRAWVIPKAALA